MKEDNKVLVYAFLVLVSIYLISYFNLISLINPTITSKVASGSFGVTVFIGTQQKDVACTSQLIFSNTAVREIITSVENLSAAGCKANITISNSTLPASWNISGPAASKVSTAIKYFELNITNQSTGSYEIHFNLSQSDLNLITTSNVKLFIEDSDWTELTTKIVDNSGFPVSFFATTSHFSRFLIGEKPAVAGPGVGGISGATGSLGRGGGKIQEKPIEKPPEPIHIPSSLFDVKVEVPENYRILSPGDIVVAKIEILNIRKIGITKVNLEYSLEDKNKNVVYKEYETKVLENELTYFKEIKVPESLKEDYYMFVVKIIHEDETAIGGYPFFIKEKKPQFAVLDYILPAGFIITIIISLVFLRLKKVRNIMQENIRKSNISKQIKKLRV
jgi:PGF-pre-PGF domain-containing protein